jgi:hypothetical protein
LILHRFKQLKETLSLLWNNLMIGPVGIIERLSVKKIEQEFVLHANDVVEHFVLRFETQNVAHHLKKELQCSHGSKKNDC